MTDARTRAYRFALPRPLNNPSDRWRRHELVAGWIWLFCEMNSKSVGLIVRRRCRDARSAAALPHSTRLSGSSLPIRRVAARCPPEKMDHAPLGA